MVHFLSCELAGERQRGGFNILVSDVTEMLEPHVSEAIDLYLYDAGLNSFCPPKQLKLD